MKKFVSFLLVFVMIMSMACTAFASEVNAETTTEGSDIMPYGTIALSFSNLAPGSCRYSTATYYVNDEDTWIKISSCTWTPATQDISIGFYNVDTGVRYGCTFEDGEIDPISITSAGVPDGEYRIYVKNNGSKTVSGVLNYSVT